MPPLIGFLLSFSLLVIAFFAFPSTYITLHLLGLTCIIMLALLFVPQARQLDVYPAHAFEARPGLSSLLHQLDQNDVDGLLPVRVVGSPQRQDHYSDSRGQQIVGRGQQQRVESRGPRKVEIDSRLCKSTKFVQKGDEVSKGRRQVILITLKIC